ncbi:PIG-L deacetylase family protein [Bacillus infantis]|uniref:PIG-L deacetylase family protein n=1 Tax=Bacillus infantis TaxID=324767 RepID=UPI0021554CA9|nr:PIG-L family deacetylase [Bacillus infantis]MCR6611404.1 PIG-L family deacetylase [Bacillus infantis]
MKSKTLKRMSILLVILFVFLLLGSVSAIIYANYYVNDGEVPVSQELFPEDEPKRVLALFAHPDDEIMVSGTFSKLGKQKDAFTALAVFTRGEAGPDGGVVPRDKFGDERTKEMKKSAEIIGADRLEFYDFPDGGLEEVNGEEMKQVIRDLITDIKPTVLISYDDEIGLYGHPDHVVTGRLVREVAREELSKGNSPVKRHYMVTLPKPMIEVALKLSPTFKEKYPKDTSKGLPAPDIAFPMATEAAARKKVLLAHRTQKEVISSVQPYYDKIPASIYYRIFDREYFYLAESDDRE